MATITLLVNGSQKQAEALPDETLLSVLRNGLGLTGTKYGCGEGQCGACTVLLDGKAARSCRTPAILAGGKKIITIQGLSPNGGLHPIQPALLAEKALHCRYCRPRMTLT